MNIKPKTVLLFTLPSFSGGGAERVFLNLINNMSRDIFEVHVVVGKFEGIYCNDLTHNVTLHEIGTTKALYSLGKFIKIILKVKPDIVLSTLGYVVTSSIASLVISNKIVFISRFGNTLSAFLEHEKSKSRVRYYFQYLLNKSVIHLSDLLIVQSNHMRDDLKKTFRLNNNLIQKIIKINNPVEFDLINLTEKNNVFNDFFNNNFVFISVGALKHQKNYEDLLKAFKLVIKDFPNTRLMILGEGANRASLEKIISDNNLNNSVLLPGFINNPESIVSKSDFFVSSSIYEGVSNAILESLALGIPVIATNCPSGIGEIIDEGKNGYLVSVDGNIVENLAKKMSFVIRDYEVSDSIKISKKIKEEFDINIISKQYEIVFLYALKKT